MRNQISIQHIFGIFLILNILSAGAEPVDSLEDIVVSGTRSNQQGIVIPGSIKIISAQDIRNSGATHIVEVLRNQGGIQLSDLFGDGSRTTVSMRGFGGNAQANTLILVDGRRLNNTDLGIPDINSVLLKDIDRIEILRGSAGVLFGDQAVGGIINIITIQPQDFSMDIDLQYGSFNKRAAEFRVYNRMDNGLGVRFTGIKRKSDNYRDNNEQDYSNIHGYLDYIYQTGELFIQYQDIDEDLEAPGALFIDQVHDNREQAFNPQDFINTDTRNFRTGLRQDLIDHWEIQAEYTNRLAQSTGLLSVGGISGPFLTKRDHREFTPRLTGEFYNRYGPVLLTAGADIFTTDFFLNSILGSIDNEQNQYAVYTQAVIPLSQNLSLTAGGRHARVENNITGALLPPDTEINDSVNAYEAGLSYQRGDHLRLFGRIASNYRFVLADEYTSASFGGVIPDTQTGRSYELGFDWSGYGANINFVYFHLDLEDEIDFDPVQFINTNIGDTNRDGIIIDAKYSLFNQLTLGANYSFVDAEIEDGPLAGLDIPFVARHTVKLSAAYRFTDYLIGQIEAHGISDRVVTGDFFNTVPALSGYVISNLNLSYERGPFNLGIRVNNLFDKEYSDNAQIGFRPPFFAPETTLFPAPERNFLATFSYNFK